MQERKKLNLFLTNNVFVFIMQWNRKLVLISRERTDLLGQWWMYYQDSFSYRRQKLNKLRHEIQLTGEFNLVLRNWLTSDELRSRDPNKVIFLSLHLFIQLLLATGLFLSYCRQALWYGGETSYLETSSYILLIPWSKRKSFVLIKSFTPKLSIAYLLCARSLMKITFYQVETENK